MEIWINRAFVEAIYRNVLGKDGDSEGVAYWTGYIDSGKSRSDMVSDFVQASLSSDLTKENFPNLSDDELRDAQARQDLITNKVEVGLNFTTILGDLTNITDNSNPENDPAYRASIKILEGVTEDSATVNERVRYLNSINNESNPIKAINNGSNEDSVFNNSEIGKKLFDFYKNSVNSEDLSEFKINSEQELNWDWGHINLIYTKLKINKLDSAFELIDSWDNDRGFSIVIEENGTISTKVKYNNTDYVFYNIKANLKENNTYNLVIWVNYYCMYIMLIDNNDNSVSKYDLVIDDGYTWNAGYYSSNSYPTAYNKPTYIRGNQKIQLLETFSVRNMDKYFNLKSPTGYYYPDWELMLNHLKNILVVTDDNNGNSIDLNNGLVAYYKFDGNAKDSSGNGNDGQIENGVTFTNGILNQCAVFSDKKEIRIKVPDSNSLDTHDFFHSTW